MAKTPPPTTVKTRIAVAVDSEGNWNAVGAGTAKKQQQSNERAADEAMDYLSSNAPTQRVVFVEAEVPVPQIIGKTVQGAVVGEPKPRKKA